MATKHVKLNQEKNSITCPKCNGNGTVKIKKWTASGPVLEIIVCPFCEGAGAIIAIRADPAERRR